MTIATNDRAAANVATISEIYAAFGRRDIPAILDRIAPDCCWESWADNRAQLAGLPTMQPRIGPAGVAEFFAAVSQLDFRDFRVLDLLVSDRQIVAEVQIEYTTPVGSLLSDEELHLWTLNDQQQVVRLRHYVDTAKHIAAFQRPNDAASREQNKALARRFVVEHNQAGYLDTFEALLGTDCVVHEYLPGMPIAMDRQALEQFIATFRRALPDIRNSVEDILAEGDRVSVRWTGHGTHTGEPLLGKAARGGAVTAHGTYVFRFAGDRIVEIWNTWDNLNVLQQMGG